MMLCCRTLPSPHEYKASSLSPIRAGPQVTLMFRVNYCVEGRQILVYLYTPFLCCVFDIFGILPLLRASTQPTLPSSVPNANKPSLLGCQARLITLAWFNLAWMLVMSKSCWLAVRHTLIWLSPAPMATREGSTGLLARQYTNPAKVGRAYICLPVSK